MTTKAREIPWRTIAEIVALLSVVLSLVFVGMEIRISREISLAEFYEAPAETDAAIASVLSENPTIWLKGCANEDLSPEEQLIFNLQWGAYGSKIFSRYMRSQSGIVEDQSDRWAWEIALNMHRHPGLRDAWVAEGRRSDNLINHTYLQGRRARNQRPEYGNLVEQFYSEMQELEPNPQYDVSYCGQ